VGDRQPGLLSPLTPRVEEDGDDVAGAGGNQGRTGGGDGSVARVARRPGGEPSDEPPVPRQVFVDVDGSGAADEGEVRGGRDEEAVAFGVDVPAEGASQGPMAGAVTDVGEGAAGAARVEGRKGLPEG